MIVLVEMSYDTLKQTLPFCTEDFTRSDQVRKLTLVI